MHAHSSQNERVVRDLLDTISHSILGCKDFASNLLSVAVYAQAVAGQVIRQYYCLPIFWFFTISHLFINL